MSTTVKAPGVRAFGITRAYLAQVLKLARRWPADADARQVARDTTALIERAQGIADRAGATMRERHARGEVPTSPGRTPYTYTIATDWPDEPGRGQSVSSGLRVEQVAEMLGGSVSAVRSSLAKARGEMVRTRVVPVERKHRVAYGPRNERVRYRIARETGTEHASQQKANKT